MSEKPPGVDVLNDAYRRWEDAPPVQLKIQRKDAFVTMMALQTAIRLPGIGAPMARHMEHVGRQIQEVICDTAELYALAESGWNPALDVDPNA